jgi:hypothetical protein
MIERRAGSHGESSLLGLNQTAANEGFRSLCQDEADDALLSIYRNKEVQLRGAGTV